MIRAGIIGATGYAGAEIARLLLSRDDVSITGYGSRSYTGERFSSIYQNLYGSADTDCSDDDMEKMSHEADVIFTATPQGFCMSHINSDILSRCRVIDLSADFRIKDIDTYEKWYGLKHENRKLVEEAIYGLPEINRDKIKTARLIANPGCYPTCSFLSIQPFVREGLIDNTTIIIDAKSGTTGAGRGAKVANLFCEVNENIKAYGVTTHRHTPEIEEQLSYASGSTKKDSITISFTPHLVPMMRGILVTAYAKLKPGVDSGQIDRAYKKCYEGERFVRVLPHDKDTVPQTRFVEGSNFADLAYRIDERTNRVIMMGAIDNLIKGAAGQAIQNMNLMFGLPEDKGLCQLPVFP